MPLLSTIQADLLTRKPQWDYLAHLLPVRPTYRNLARYGSKGRVVWCQQLELLSGLDREEHCAYPVHGHLQSAAEARTCRAG